MSDRKRIKSYFYQAGVKMTIFRKFYLMKLKVWKSALKMQQFLAGPTVCHVESQSAANRTVY